MQVEQAGATARERYADRYGLRGPRRGALIVTASVLISLAVAWAVWVGIAAGRRPVLWSDVGFSVRGDAQMQLTFDVEMAPGTRAVCTVQALSQTFSVVGRLDVPVGPSSARVLRRTVTIPTIEPAATAQVKDCALR